MIEVDFNDRVPTYAGRVILTPVSGQENTFDMVRADEPTVEGTPIDKATFDSITQSRLTGRYYVPEFSKVENGSYADITTNPIPTTWKKETSGRATSGTWAVYSSINDDSEVYFAVDGSNTTRWISALSATSEFILDTGNVLSVKKMRLYTTAINGTYTALTISGSNNGETWTPLYTAANITEINEEITLSTIGEFKLYRIYFENSGSNVSASIWEWAFTEYDFKTYSNTFTVESGVPIEWTTGQIITVEIPANADTLAVISCTFNGVSINAILQPTKRYELTYNGTSFDAKEV